MEIDRVGKWVDGEEFGGGGFESRMGEKVSRVEPRMNWVVLDSSNGSEMMAELGRRWQKGDKWRKSGDYGSLHTVCEHLGVNGWTGEFEWVNINGCEWVD